MKIQNFCQVLSLIQTILTETMFYKNVYNKYKKDFKIDTKRFFFNIIRGNIIMSIDDLIM